MDKKLTRTRKSRTKQFMFLIFVGFFYLVPSLMAQSDFRKESAFSDGEWLKYKVKWGIFRLGTLEIFQKKVQDIPGTIYQVEMHARSANLPFINVFFINEGMLNPYRPTLRHFTLTSGREKERVSTYIYNPEQNMILLETQDHQQIVRKDSLFYEDGIYDALGMFMMMRCLSSSGFNITLKNIVEFQLCQTRLNFTGQRGMIKVGALPEPIVAVKFEGKAEWVGKSWAGVSGPFRGWISADPAAVPVKVSINIFLGSITLELEDFSRSDWPNDINRDSVAKK